ncbi:MAG: crossover junction endodeoxyribonuclease RuvC [Puniceicoccales bacterium]|nr:crossover junction endodeoxyribonuclease RuvC [Puniceicoccales bacterium]
MAGGSARFLWTKKLAVEGKKVLRKKYCPRKNVSVIEKFGGVVIGIDASLRGTGIAIVDFSAPTPKLLFSEKITCHRKLSLSQCIGKIFAEISAALGSFTVNVAAIEQTIYVQNHKTSHTLGAAKGAAIAAVTNGNLEVFEYAPLSIKMAITGTGTASKEQVRRTIEKLLGSGNISYDESDAAGIACCHAWRRKLNFPANRGND